MLSFSPGILITFEFLTLPTAVIVVGIAGSDCTVRERVRETFKTCSSLPHLQSLSKQGYLRVWIILANTFLLLFI